MKKFGWLLVAFGILFVFELSTQSVLAQEIDTAATRGANETGDSSSGSKTKNSTTPNVRTAGPGGSSSQRTDGNSINDGAKSGGNNAMKGLAINVGVGAVMYNICSSCSPACTAYCIMGGMAFAQAMTQGKAAGDFRNVDYNTGMPTFDPNGLISSKGSNVGSELKGGATGHNTASTGGKFNRDSLLKKYSGKINSGLKALKGMGYDFDVKSGLVTTPDGKKIPFSAMSSDSGMASMGFTPGQIANSKRALKKAIADAEAKYSVSGMGLASGGGGGGGGRYGSNVGVYEGDGVDPLQAYLDSLKRGKNKKRKPAGLAGMKRIVGGDAIGVKADDIFQMIHRRYDKKRKNREFLER